MVSTSNLRERSFLYVGLTVSGWTESKNCLKLKLYLFYNDKETSYFNLYKSRWLAGMVA